MFITSKEALQSETAPELRHAYTRQVNPQSTDGYGGGSQLKYNFDLGPGEVLNPAESIFLLNITLTVGGVAALANNACVLYNFWPMKLFDRIDYQINESTVMQSSKPASEAERLYYALTSDAARDNLADMLQVNVGAIGGPTGTRFNGVRTAFVVGVKPSLAAWFANKKIPHGRHSISFDVKNYAIATIASTVGTVDTVTINSMRLYARIEKPWEMPKLKNVYVPTMKLQTLPQTLAAGTQSVTEKTVPSSTRMLFLHFAATADSGYTPIDLATAQPSQIRINVNGQNIPNASYSNLYSTTAGTQMRLYYDTIQALEGFIDPTGVPFTFEEWSARPFLAVRCPSDSGSTDPNVVLDVTCAAACVAVLTPMGDSAIELKYSSGSLAEANEILVV